MQANSQLLSPQEATRRIEQLDLELRMLKDDNYRIREEHLRLERNLREVSDGARREAAAYSCAGAGYGGSGYSAAHPSGVARGLGAAGVGAAAGGALGRGSGQGRVNGDQQLAYMREMVRNLQEENRRLKTIWGGQRWDRPAAEPLEGFVSEEKCRALHARLAQLQQQHLQHLQEARLIQGGRSSAGGSAPNSGLSTPVSTNFGRFSGASSTAAPQSRGHTPQDSHALRSQYEAIMREQEMLRSKVRKLAAVTTC